MSQVTSVLSDGTIRRLVEEGRLKIEPWDPSLVQPASVDLRLGTRFASSTTTARTRSTCADPPKDLTEQVKIGLDESFVIHPGEFALGAHAGVGRAAGRHRGADRGQELFGRLGLIVHATAGFVDPGLEGTLTLEITNLTRVPIKLCAGHADRPAVVHGARPPGRAALRASGPRQPLPRASWTPRSRATGPRPKPPPGDGVVSPAVLHAVLTFAAEEAEEPDKTPFYIAGDRPGRVGARGGRDRHPQRALRLRDSAWRRAVMAVSAVLVARHDGDAPS